MEWCGDTTLDDLVQKTPTGELNPILQNTVRRFCQLEEGFAKTAHALNPYIYPLDYSVFLQDIAADVIGSRAKNPRLFGVAEGRANARRSSSRA